MRKIIVVSVSLFCINFSQAPTYALTPVSISPQISIVDTGGGGGSNSGVGSWAYDPCDGMNFSKTCTIKK
jgi:hypothetical protein